LTAIFDAQAAPTSGSYGMYEEKNNQKETPIILCAAPVHHYWRNSNDHNSQYPARAQTARTSSRFPGKSLATIWAGSLSVVRDSIGEAH
jgi:hypothetical protein